MNEQTRRIIARAEDLQRLESAARVLRAKPCFRWDWRAGLAAGLGALLSLIPSVSAAQMILH